MYNTWCKIIKQDDQELLRSFCPCCGQAIYHEPALKQMVLAKEFILLNSTELNNSLCLPCKSVVSSL